MFFNEANSVDGLGTYLNRPFVRTSHDEFYSPLS